MKSTERIEEGQQKFPFYFPFARIALCFIFECDIITDHISVSGSRSTFANIPFHTLYKGILFFNLVADYLLNIKAIAIYQALQCVQAFVQKVQNTRQASGLLLHVTCFEGGSLCLEVPQSACWNVIG